LQPGHWPHYKTSSKGTNFFQNRQILNDYQQGNRIKIFQKVKSLIIKYTFLRIYATSKNSHN